MILFAEDWQKYPTAIADTQTKNLTFLRQAQIYRQMGIKNHAFLLALHQPELQGVDPYDPNLTLDQKTMIGMECRFNPWYYFREVLFVPPQAGPNPVQFRANRGNIALIWSFFNNIDCGLIQPRQTGKSVSVDGLMVNLIYISSSNSKINMITKDDTLRKANVDRLKSIRDILPKYLINVTSRDADNQNELTCNTLGNRYNTGVAQNSESAANNLGRGLTAPITQFDEGPFINFIGVTVPAALAAGIAARAEAELHNRPYGNLFTTTAGKKDDRDGRFMYDMIHGGAVWNERFFDCANKHELKEVVKLNGSGRKALLNITMSHRQLGYTDEWLYDQIAMTGSTGEAADRDFFNIWTSGTQRSPLTVALNEIINKSEMDVLHTEISPDNYILRWYIPEDEIRDRMADGNYVMGLDTSEAVGRDTIAMVIVDVRDLSVIAAGTYNETNLIRFAAYLLWLLVRYTTTTLVIERKSSAQTIIDYLTLKLPMAGHDPFKRLYNKIVDEFREKRTDYEALTRRLEQRDEAFYDLRKAAFGFFTNKDNRILLYTTVLQNAAKQAGQLVRDKSLSAEIRGLVEKNGRIDHAASSHDDMVIAWLLCHWFLSHARNLSHYGINHATVRAGMIGDGKEVSRYDQAAKLQQEGYLAEIDTILDKLKITNDEIAIAKYEHRLKFLSTQIAVSSTEEMLSIDAMIQSSREERQKSQKLQSRQQRTNMQRDTNVWGRPIGQPLYRR